MLSDVTISPRLPQFVRPGTPFFATWTLAHHGTVDLHGASFGIRGRNIEVIGASIDNTPLDPTLVGRTGSAGIQLQLPALRPGRNVEIGAWVIVQLPLVHDPSIAYEYLQGGLRQSDDTTLLVDEPDLPLRGALVLADARAVCRGESRRGFLRLHNATSRLLQSVALECFAGDGTRATLGTQPSVLRPGETVDVPFTCDFENPPGDDVAIRASATADGFEWHDSIQLPIVAPPSLAHSSASLLDDMPVAPAGGMVSVLLRAHNSGDRTALRPAVAFRLPYGVELIDGPLVLPDIAPAETQSFTYTFRVPPVQVLTIGVRVNDEELDDLSIPVRHVASLEIARFETPTHVSQDEEFPVIAEVRCDGNATIERASVALIDATHFEYVPGSLRVNDSPVVDTVFAQDRRFAFKNVQPGALMSLRWTMRAPRPTTSAPGALSLSARWGENAERRAARTLSVAPSLTATPLFEVDVDNSPFGAIAPVPVVVADAPVVVEDDVVVRAEPPLLAHGDAATQHVEIALSSATLGADLKDAIVELDRPLETHSFESPVQHVAAVEPEKLVASLQPDEAISGGDSTSEVHHGTETLTGANATVRPDTQSETTSADFGDAPEPPRMLETGLVPAISDEHANDLTALIEPFIASSDPAERIVGIIHLLPPPGKGASMQYRALHERLSEIVQENMPYDEMRPLDDPGLQEVFAAADVDDAIAFVHLLRPVIATHFPPPFRDSILAGLALTA